MPHHRLAHPAGADDADFFLVRHDAAYSRCAGGMLGSRKDKTSREETSMRMKPAMTLDDAKTHDGGG